MSTPTDTRDVGTFDTVRKTARDGEPDRYLAALLAGPDLRDDLMTLAAFAAELSRIPTLVREPMMGEIRLQWWHDTLDGMLRGASSGHPVADRLGMVLRRHGLDPAPLHTAVEAHLFEIGRGLHDDDAALIRHLDATEGQMFLVALAITGSRPDAARAHLAMTTGRAYGLARSLSRLPALLDKGGFPIPANRLAAAGIEPETLAQDPLRPEVITAISNITADLQALARPELAAMKAGFAALLPAERNVLLPVALVEPYFAVQHRMRNVALRQLADLSPLRRQWNLWRAHRRGHL